MAPATPSPACKEMSLLELAETCMAHSLLVFLLADLRILSATGRIQTKYEHVALDSDNSHRSALEMAGAALPSYKSEGLTPAHVVALLILEIQRQADEDEGQQRNTWSRDFVESVDDLPSLLRSYQDMVASDLSKSFQVRKADYPMDVGSVHGNDEEANEYFKKSEFNPQTTVSEPGESEDLFGSLRVRLPESRPALIRRTEQRGKFMLEELVNQIKPASGKEKPGDEESSRGGECYNREELGSLLQHAVESRDASILKCISGLFKPGSIMRIVVDSPTEIVWLQDWHTQYECTYAIAVNYAERRVILAFRGAYTYRDWTTAADWNYKTTSNPIPENYEKKSKNIRVHGGFHKYLFRIRKDTGTTKYDEISSKVAQYCALVGDGYTVTITGHSLGAALTTVMTLYASTEERFTRNGPITAVTFGGPYVGGYQFSDAVRHQEDADKLRLVRFHNVGDGVPHLPLAVLSFSKRGAKHHHVGMNVRLPMIRKGVLRAFGQPQPSVSHNGKPRFIRSVLRQWNNFYFTNIPVRLWKFSNFHTLVEHKKRLSLTHLLRDEKASPLIRNTLEELYEQREELNIFRKFNACMLGWNQIRKQQSNE